MDREKAIQLAKKLANFNQENATQAEVELAATHLQRIMNDHALSELDLKAEEAKGRCSEDRQAHEWKRPPFWLKWFIGEIGRCFRVKPIFFDMHIRFIGEDTDVALAKYFAAAVLNLPLYNMMAKDWNKARKLGVDTKGYIPNWYLGFVQAIMKRLHDEYDQWYKDLDVNQQSKIRALIVIKSDAVAKFVKMRYPSLGHARMSKPRSHSAAAEAGYRQGMAAQINKGVRSTKSNPNIGG